MQLAHQDTGARHAVIALAHVHRSFMGHRIGAAQMRSALKHYNAAIANHIACVPTNDTQTKSMVPTAIMFICIEVSHLFVYLLALS